MLEGWRGRDGGASAGAGRAAWIGRLVAAVGLFVGAVPGAAWCASTPAGTVIQASAEVSWLVGSASLSVRSNAPALTVDQLIDVAVVPSMAAVPVRAGETGRSVAFRVVNTGNAPETLHLQLATALAGNGFDPLAHAQPLYLDADGSGTLTPADVAYAPGGNDPVLAPGASTVVLAVVDVPSGVGNGAHGRVEVDARVLQGNGTPGTVFAGAGPNGADAIAGPSGGAAHAASDLVVSGVDVSLLKSAVVTAADGSANPETGARIDYDIAVQVTGAGLVRGLVVSDPIPTSTHYVASSVLVDGVAQADAVAFQSSLGQIQVSLGDVPGGALHHVRFSVLIN